jgi:alkanesulfonate monooxygenase SsuD/methylene tetrahydromethanopterin reductase-like flavin-dependent oxidoreductase (luciferase family)
MEFGYFTLSDNHYENNTRSPNTFVQHITDEALYAERLGMHSAWIGEHHFNSLGVLPGPGTGLHCGAHQSDPPCAGGDRAAAAQSDPGRRAVGNA